VNDWRLTLALANAFKEGDLGTGGTRDDTVRAEARRAILGTSLRAIRTTTLIDDGVSEALARSIDRDTAADLDSLTVGDVKARLLATDSAAWLVRHRNGLTSETIAACAKVMSDEELAHVCARVFNPLPSPRARGHDGIAVGSRTHFGSRIQPNSPGDDEEEVLLSILEGLTYGCGDVILGVNPASDDIDTIIRLEEQLARVVDRLALPTRFCVLSDIVKQHRARHSTRVDVGFQSLAGTSTALAGMVGMDVDGVLDLARDFPGLYFETGQGSEVTNGAAEGVDMVTLEARTYGVARHIQRQTGVWTIVNDVAGFIGPEVFRTGAQLERACLEDCFMAKLHGLTMGLDVCATFHMGITPRELQMLTARVVERAHPAYLMAVAGNADPMLGYMTTSFREHPRLREGCGRRMTSVFEQHLRSRDLCGASIEPGADATAQAYAAYAKAGGDHRSRESLADEGRQRLQILRERGFDLGNGSADGTAPAWETRLDAIYSHARRALYAVIEESVLRSALPSHVRIRTQAASRDEYLSRPGSGERLRDADAATIARLATSASEPVTLVVSDGLNADALNEHLRALALPLRRRLGDAGCRASDVAVVIENGRVRAGYRVGEISRAEVVVHLIGERPGTGLNTLSAYITYGRDAAGRFRWASALDHACTTAICGIHPSGKTPETAAVEIARVVSRALRARKSGIELHQADRPADGR
jgi:ethanolamine ammonia-lyase large subunit